MDRKEITNWVLFVYLTLINLLFTFVAWIFWIWRDGLLTPEETTPDDGTTPCTGTSSGYF